VGSRDVGCQPGQRPRGPIAIVSGNESIAEMLCMVLEAEGYEVAVASSLQHADEVVTEDHPSVAVVEVSSHVVMDDVDPDLREAIDWRNSHPEMRAILMATELSYSGRDLARSAFDGVMDEYLLSWEWLLKAIAELMPRSDSQREKS
jgi:DNA-binding NtrC family response regulator